MNLINIFFDNFRLVLGNWQFISLGIIGVLLFYRLFVNDYYEQLWSFAPWKISWILLGILGILLIQIREIIQYPFYWIETALPGYSLLDHLFFYAGNIHIRSIMFWAVMIFYLWKKMGNLLPALSVGFFYIGLAELTFIPQHLIWQNGLFLGVQHYLPFILIMIPFLLERKRFVIPGRSWVWFSVGIFFQYFGLLFTPWAAVQLQEGGWGFVINPLAQPSPHLFTYLFDISQHLIKTFFTIAGAHVLFKPGINLNNDIKDIRRLEFDENEK
jgi:hypothetical protein